MAKNQKTSNKPGRLIAEEINKKLEQDKVTYENGKKKDQIMTISKSQVNRILNEKYTCRVVKRVFDMEKHKEKRKEFCKKMLDMRKNEENIGKKIFFTDESRIDLKPPYDKIRVDKETQEKAKKGNSKALNVMSAPQKKHYQSIMIAGGISIYGLSDLLLLNGVMDSFAYSQAIKYYNKNYEELKKNGTFIFRTRWGQKSHKQSQ